MHQGQEFVKSFVQQRYHIIRLLETLRSTAHHCFLCRRYKANNLQPIIAPLPLKRYPDENHLFPFTNAGVYLFGSFYIENKTDIEKHYGIIFTRFATRAVHLGLQLDGELHKGSPVITEKLLLEPLKN